MRDTERSGFFFDLIQNLVQRDTETERERDQRGQKNEMKSKCFKLFIVTIARKLTQKYIHSLEINECRCCGSWRRKMKKKIEIQINLSCHVIL